MKIILNQEENEKLCSDIISWGGQGEFTIEADLDGFYVYLDVEFHCLSYMDTNDGSMKYDHVYFNIKKIYTDWGNIEVVADIDFIHNEVTNYYK